MDRKDFPDWCDEETIEKILKAIDEMTDKETSDKEQE